MDVVDWSSMLARGAAIDVINMWGCVNKKYCCTLAEHGVSTMDIIWKWIIWDLSCILQGTFRQLLLFV